MGCVRVEWGGGRRGAMGCHVPGGALQGLVHVGGGGRWRESGEVLRHCKGTEWALWTTGCAACAADMAGGAAWGTCGVREDPVPPTHRSPRSLLTCCHRCCRRCCCSPREGLFDELLEELASPSDDSPYLGQLDVNSLGLALFEAGAQVGALGTVAGGVGGRLLVGLLPWVVTVVTDQSKAPKRGANGSGVGSAEGGRAGWGAMHGYISIRYGDRGS